MYFSGLKPYLRSEAVGIGVLKGVQVAVCGIRCTYLNNDMLKILGNYFSYKKKWKEEKNLFKTATDIQRVLKIWKIRNLPLEGKIVIFKTIAIYFLWNNSTPKIKHEALCNDCKAGGLKNINIPNKIIALQCS